MISFRKFAMTGAMLAAFAGLASAAASKSTFAPVPVTSFNTLRSEGLTEALPPVSFTATLDAAPTAITTVTYNLSIFAGAPITSAPGSIVLTGTAAGTATVSGTAVTIPVVFTFAPGALTSQVNISGLRIDANALPVGSLVTLSAVATPTVATGDFTNVSTSVPLSVPAFTVGSVIKGLTTTVDHDAKTPVTFPSTGNWTSGGTTAFDPASTTTTTGLPLFNVKFAPGFAGAFRYTPAVAAVTGGPAAIQAEKLRLMFAIANIPTGLSLYVPTTISAGAAQLSLVTGADANGMGGTLAPASPLYQLINASGVTTGMAVYEFTTPDPTSDAVTVPVYSVGATPVALTTAAAPFTLKASFAPLSTDTSATETPGLLRFAMTSVTTSDSFLVVTSPTSVLVFPYVVVGNGWVTGIAITNGGSGFSTATDATKGASGMCSLTFYSADGTAVAPAAITTTAITPGGNSGFTLNSKLPAGTSYAGLVVANCDFDHAYGFVYLTGNGTTAAYTVAPQLP